MEYLGETADWMTYEFPPYDGPPHGSRCFAASGRNGSRSASLGDEREIMVADTRNGQEPEFEHGAGSGWRVAELVVPFRREVYLR